jgi:hypothetical protein
MNLKQHIEKLEAEMLDKKNNKPKSPQGIYFKKIR